ncbi:coiled-coil domain-containing protein 201 [Pongo pygmaeus]|uniref:coiled-coil domain-containing protein 201 n=1 Tax=Pongo pygmaeus TaxID=9600 RepID=UPI0023E147B7|nr:coiled-coil domain-containing protein 201 [Pongo pygmaeus]XP_054415103.1 coiled-coil domain-containing protein 201 [Pongo abelii]
MEPGVQDPGLSSSEDESPSLAIRSPTLRKPLKHSTPEEAALGWSPRSSGGASYLSGSPMPAHFSQVLASHPAGVSPPATVRKMRLSTIWASKESSLDLSALGEEPPTSASLAQQQQQQQEESLRAKSWPQNPGLPGILNTTGRKRRDLKKRAAAMERVRQWEIYVLQNIEEATQHELTIEDD